MLKAITFMTLLHLVNQIKASFKRELNYKKQSVGSLYL